MKLTDKTDQATRRTSDRQTPALARSYGDALRVADGHRAESIALAALGPLSGPGVYSRIIAPAMHWIGDLYDQNAITVADVHVATAISHRVAAALYPSMSVRAADSRETIVVAAPVGQHHSLGLRMAADVLEGAGFRVIYLGTDVPTDALAAAVGTFQPALVCLALSAPADSEKFEQAMASVAETRPGTPVLAGGLRIDRSLPSDRLPYVPSVESLVATAERLIENDDRVCGRAATPSDALEPPAEPDWTRGSATLENRMLKATEETSDLVREQARLTRKFRALAFEDHLCGLANRRAFDQRYEELTGDTDVPSLVVMLLDLDGFKQINDDHGHKKGDEALIVIADVLRRQLRETDLSARVGGDEFAALIPGVDLVSGRRVAERVRRAVAAAWSEPQLAVSIGLALSDGDRLRTLQQADVSLYEAKAIAHLRPA